MGGEGHNYDGYGGLSSQDHRTDCGDYGKEGRRRGMGVGLGINYYREFLHLGRTTAYKNSEWEALYSNR